MSPSGGKDKPDNSDPSLAAINKVISAEMVFLSITRTNLVDTQKLKRLVCYALADLHPKGTSINHITLQLQGALGCIESPAQDIYQALRIGRRWKDIVSWVSEKSGCPLTGILHVLKGPIWEREAGWQTALDQLTFDILHKAKSYSDVINKILSEIKGRILIIFEPSHAYISVAHLTFVPSPEPKVYQGTSGHSEIQQAITTAFEAFPKLKATGATNAAYLMILLSFFANCEVSIDILSGGASPRKRWSKLGEIVETYPGDVGILQDTIHICNSQNLMNILAELYSISAIVWTSHSTFKLNKAIRDSIQSSFSKSLQSFWGMQALTLAYRSIPWKNLDQMWLDTALAISHIQHTFEEARRHCSLKDIAPMVRTDMGLSLIESSRFLNMEWKQFAISQAEELAIGIDDGYIHSCLVQRQCVLHRLSGNMGFAFPHLPDVVSGHSNIRLHAALGHVLIQGALDCIQRDELSKAVDFLEKWRPVQQPSAMEYIVLFRQNLIFGKIFRYKGDFSRSLSFLKMARRTAEVTENLIFREDTCELACNLAETYLELENPTKAEVCLRAEMKHQYSKQALLVVLAEALFAQARFEEADSLCHLLRPPLKLRKMERLRLSIIQAKLSHARNRFDIAFSYWTEAMENLRLFNLAGGHTTCIILRSQCDVLQKQGLRELERQSYKQLQDLQNYAGSDGTLYWIAGLRHWLKYLDSGNSPESISI
ncbi:LipA and NB-ARC domain protein [Aspergillus stella-maris]|uniref:LipA and NB-ARC domain protein n=1 Tax=Aspergillus stella-maris TaxID=1810926 RepID=UPI003CCE2F65